MFRPLIAPENSKLRNAFGWALVAVLTPFGLVVGAIDGTFGRGLTLTASEVAAYIRAMLDGTVFEEGAGFDYDEFSSVRVANPQLGSLVSRACRAFEKSTPDRAVLEGLLAEAEALARRA